MNARGFSLIELMIVVAVVAILSAVAIPSYRDYTIRAQVTEGLNLASDLKAGIGEVYAQTGTFTGIGRAQVGVSGANTKSGKYVTGIDVQNGIITITYGGQANSKIAGDTLALSPGSNVNEDVIWVCGNKDEPSGTTLASRGTTSLSDKYMPANCRTGS